MSFDLGTGDRAAWESVNAVFSAPVLGPARPPWWRRNLRWLALGLVADVVIGALVLRALREESSTPQRAVVAAADLIAKKDYAGLRASLCAPDRARYSVGELADAGRQLHLVMHGVEKFVPEQVTVLPDVRLGPVGLPARRVDGQVVAMLGPPSAAHVTVVQEPTAWKVCLSAGGYGLAILGVDEPLHEDLLS